MIFHFDLNSAKDIVSHGAQYSDLLAAIIENHHYVDCDANIADALTKQLNTHGSTTQKELLAHYRGFSITLEQTQYLTTIDAGQYPCADLIRLARLKALLLVENKTYEWPVYEKMMELYVSDRKYGSLFSMLVNAKNKQKLDGLHSGGYTSYVSLLKNYQSSTSPAYQEFAPLKISLVLDRDTDNDHSFDSKKNGVFRFLINKESQDVQDGDIYTLHQPTPWIWHMWYKRAIENYFPNKQFVALHCDVTSMPSSQSPKDYFKINGTSVPNYSKACLSKLTNEMTRADFEAQNLKKFQVNGEQVSEIQLFLLKLLKII